MSSRKLTPLIISVLVNEFATAHDHHLHRKGVDVSLDRFLAHLGKHIVDNPGVILQATGPELADMFNSLVNLARVTKTREVGPVISKMVGAVARRVDDHTRAVIEGALSALTLGPEDVARAARLGIEIIEERCLQPVPVAAFNPALART